VNFEGVKQRYHFYYIEINAIIIYHIITPAIKHVNKFCGIPVFPENGDHALIYLVAGVIIKIPYL
jgi:hypothetical protein